MFPQPPTHTLTPTHTHLGGGGREKKERIYSSTYCSRSENHFLAHQLPWPAAAVFIWATEQSHQFGHPVLYSQSSIRKYLLRTYSVPRSTVAIEKNQFREIKILF